MRRLLFSLLLICSLNIFAKDSVIPTVVVSDISSLQVNQLFDETNKLDKITKYADLVVKEEKINICIAKYVDDQSKSFAKIAQNNLYDLLNNFDKIISKIYGDKKQTSDDGVTYEEKLEALATVQCEVYYAMGVLK